MLILAVTETTANWPAVARCAWFNGYVLESDDIPIDQLVVVPRPAVPSSAPV